MASASTPYLSLKSRTPPPPQDPTQSMANLQRFHEPPRELLRPHSREPPPPAPPPRSTRAPRTTKSSVAMPSSSSSKALSPLSSLITSSTISTSSLAPAPNAPKNQTNSTTRPRGGLSRAKKQQNFPEQTHNSPHLDQQSSRTPTTNSTAPSSNSDSYRRLDTLTSLINKTPLSAVCSLRGCCAAPEQFNFCGQHCHTHCCGHDAGHYDGLSLRLAGARRESTARCQHRDGCSAKIIEGCSWYCRAHCCRRATERNRAELAKRMERERRREKREAARRDRAA